MYNKSYRGKYSPTRLPQKIAGNEKHCDVMIDQSRVVDNRRFKKQLDKIPETLMREIERKLLLCADLLSMANAGNAL